MKALFGRKRGPTLVLDRVVGHGGMSVVWAADYGGERVAAKVPLEHLAAEFDLAALVHEEARVWAMLDHPGIVRLIAAVPTAGAEGVGDARQLPTLVLEYVEGASVEQLLARDVRVPGGVVVPLALGVLDALEYLASHAPVAPVVHRDVAPANVLVTVAGQARLTDFGLAHAAQRARLTRTGELRGRMRVLGPRRLAGAAPSPWDDLYGLMVTLVDAALGLAALKRFHPLAAGEAAEAGLPGPLVALAGRLVAGDETVTHAEFREVCRACRPRLDAESARRWLARAVAESGAGPTSTPLRATPVLAG
jgi:eukaryotic-like serine/threonine-protein kinase